MAARQGRGRRRGELDATLRSLAEGLRVVTVLLQPYMPASTTQLLAALGRPSGAGDRRGELRRAARRRDGRPASRAAVPEAVIDSHTHLDSLRAGPTPSSSPAAERPACTRILTVGMDGASCRTALAAAEDFPQVFAAIGRHPNHADRLRRRRPRRARRRSPRTSAASRSARPAWTTTATTPPAPTSSAPSTRRSSSRARPASRSSSTRARPRTTRSRMLRRARRGRTRDPALLLDAARASTSASSDGWWISFAGNVTYPKAARPRATPRASVPADRLLVETDAPYLSAAGGAQGAQPAGLRRPHRRASSPSCAASPTRSSRPRVERNAAELFGW